MHKLFNHIVNYLCKALIIISFFLPINAYAEQSAEEIIKGRKALFSKNYNTAKKVQALSSSSDFDEAKKLMLEMSENYKSLLKMFPENTKEGFKTEALALIWEEKDEFNFLMKKSSNDMNTLVSVIENTDDIRGTLGKLMWENCKACHSKYREEH
jgi:cytochrome c556